MKDNILTPKNRVKVQRAATGTMAVLCWVTATLAAAQSPAPLPVPAQNPVSPALAVTAPVPQPPTQPASFLAWDAEAKTFDAKPGELAAHFTFYVTNVSPEVVVITSLQRSCGCTEASLPTQPWSLAPGTNGPIHASIDLRGKTGKISKALTVIGSTGSKILMLNVNIPPSTNPNPALTPAPASPSPTNSTSMDRSRNQQAAALDRQAVFKGDCAQCHAQPTVGKLGHELYQAGCAICHDAEHRAEMVPDLRALTHQDNAEQLKQWITDSMPGSMMPAFAQTNGGPLNDEQIASLVDYLARVMRKS